ncbi:MAG: hypothetical protein ACXACU_10875 [Candidatus Hodarchaeales archaeon]
MSSNTIIPKLEELLVSKYFLSDHENVEAINLCDSLGEELELTELAEKEFYTRILQHLRFFFNAEFMFLKKRNEKALKTYQKLMKAISETLTQFPDYYSRWQYHIDRLLLRIDARIQNSKAKVLLTQNNYVEAEVLYVETINRYNNELEFEQNNNDYDHYFDSLGNIFLTTGDLYQLRGKNRGNRKELYLAIKNLKKAQFLGQPHLDPVLEEIRNEIATLTLTHLETQAETFFNKGGIATEKESFEEAKISYQKSSQLFRSLKNIQPSIEYELQEQIQISSYYEAHAKSLMINDANEQASLQFAQANQTLQLVLDKIPSDALRQNFEPQILYFQAMQQFCQAVIEYDNMIETAPTRFNETQVMLEKSKAKAEELDNLPLVNNCQEALNKLKSYQEIAGLMFQEPVFDKPVEDIPTVIEQPIETESIPLEEEKTETEIPIDAPPVKETPTIIEKPIETESIPLEEEKTETEIPIDTPPVAHQSKKHPQSSSNQSKPKVYP